jgi:hypothetical protein
MEQLWAFIHYLQDNPSNALGLVGVLIGIRYLLNRKSRLSREADERLERLREERGDYYNNIRPLR